MPTGVKKAAGLTFETKTIDDTPSSRRFYYVNKAGEDGFRPVEEVFA